MKHCTNRTGSATWGVFFLLAFLANLLICIAESINFNGWYSEPHNWIVAMNGFLTGTSLILTINEFK